MTANGRPHGSRLWELIDPSDYDDGILYLPEMLEVQPRMPQWGHPGAPGLRERIANDRPQGLSGQKLLCLLCMRINADAGREPEPIWLTFVESRWGPYFRHENGRSPHTEHQPETDIHKALKERKARTWGQAGATEVRVESWRPRAGRRPDVLAIGPRLTVAGEVQHSTARPRVIQARQKALAKAGDRVVWTTDINAADIRFLHVVPHLVVPALGDHRRYLSDARLEIGAGAITFEPQRCGWPDIWHGGGTRCPVTRKSAPCSQWHLYPTFNPRDYNRTASVANATFPCGPRVHLDHLLEGILHGQWLPYRWRGRVTWIPADAHDQVVAERGGSVEAAEAAAVRRRDRAAERACEKRLGIIPDQDEASVVEHVGICCGGRTGRPGERLLNACMLCPKSSSYWRRREV